MIEPIKLLVLIYFIFVNSIAFSETNAVALIEDRAEGFPSNYQYARLFSPVLGRGGHVAFNGYAKDIFTNEADKPAVWSGLPGRLRKVISKDDTITGLSQNEIAVEGFILNGIVKFSDHSGSSGNLLVNQSGVVALSGTIIINSTITSAVLVEIEGAVKVILHDSQFAPGYDSGIAVGFGGFTLVAFSDEGLLISGSAGRTVNSDRVLWLWKPHTQSFSIVVKSSDDLTSIIPNCSLTNHSPIGLDAVINQSGKIAFKVCNSIVMWQNNQLSVVIKEGDSVPNFPAGSIFTNIGNFSINDLGDIAFTATIKNNLTSNSQSRDSAWLLASNNNLKLITIAGEKDPLDQNAFIESVAKLDGINSKGNSVIQAFKADGSSASIGISSILTGLPKQSYAFSDFNNFGQSHLDWIVNSGTELYSAIINNSGTIIYKPFKDNFPSYVRISPTGETSPVSETMIINGTEYNLRVINLGNLSIDGSTNTGRATLMSDSGMVAFYAKTQPSIAIGIFTVSSTNSSSVETGQVDCLLDWGEDNFQALLKPRRTMSLSDIPPFFYRHYIESNTYLGISFDNWHLYFLDSDKNLVDLGLVKGWLEQANCI